MKCTMCNGTGKCYEQKIRYQEIEINRTDFTLAKCHKCNGTGEVVMTNEEWLCLLSTEEKAEWLSKHFHCGDCIFEKPMCDGDYDGCKSSFVEWLKGEHNDNVGRNP